VSWNIERIARIVVFSLISYVAFNYVFKRWGEAIEEWLLSVAENIRARYVWLRQTFSPTQLWLLIHLIPLGMIATVPAVNRVFGFGIRVDTLFIAAAALMALESGIYMYLMRDVMRRSLLFAAAASIIIFKPWEDPMVLALLNSSFAFAYLIITFWNPDKILERIGRELGIPFAEGEFLERLKTLRGALLIAIGTIVGLAKWVTYIFQDSVLRTHVRQLILLPTNIVAVVAVTILLQYPEHQPLNAFVPKAVRLTGLLMVYWGFLWTARWLIEGLRRASHLVNYAREDGQVRFTIGNSLTLTALVTFGMVTTAVGMRLIPTIVGEGTAWLYAEALPYMETVGELAARIISALV